MNSLSSWTVFATFATSLVVAFPIGCGPKRPRIHLVEGVVQQNGEPVANAFLHFAPIKARGGLTASGQTDQEGKFVLWTGCSEGCAAGNYRVTIQRMASPLEPSSHVIPSPMVLKKEIHIDRDQQNLILEISQD
ncbi:MAG: hypothetical protein U0905_04615 [Pirellulales bacterium]